MQLWLQKEDLEEVNACLSLKLKRKSHTKVKGFRRRCKLNINAELRNGQPGIRENQIRSIQKILGNCDFYLYTCKYILFAYNLKHRLFNTRCIELSIKNIYFSPFQLEIIISLFNIISLDYFHLFCLVSSSISRLALDAPLKEYH